MRPVLVVFIIRAIRPDDKHSKHFHNIDKLLPDYTAQQSIRQSSL
jgi:hypothetical protein